MCEENTLQNQVEVADNSYPMMCNITINWRKDFWMAYNINALCISVSIYCKIVLPPLPGMEVTSHLFIFKNTASTMGLLSHLSSSN